MAKPLFGLKVLDLTRVQQGPQATGLLCDLGADVIKVEDPAGGDQGRGAGRVEDRHHYGTLFLIYNRGKRDIAVDLKSAEGREIIYRLAAGVDIIAHNFRPGVMERLGFGFDKLKEINPTIVYAEANGLGSAGPRAGLPVFDLLGQAASGLVSVNGTEKDPVQVGAFVADAGGAAMFTSAILAGVVARQLSGRAQRVEVSELGSMIALQGWELTYFAQKGEHVHAWPGDANPKKWFSGVFKTADGHIAISNLGRKAEWPALAEAFDVVASAADERFRSQEARTRSVDALTALLKAALLKRTSVQWMERLVPLAVCCHPVATYGEVMEDPQALANGYVVEIDHPERGKLRAVGCPIKFAGLPLPLPPTCPEVGEHTDEILAEIGYSPEEIALLKSAKTVLSS
jgi:formyl-CoA transferase